MITEDYVSFETAKLLKEKGFDAECYYLYVDGEFVGVQGCACNWNDGKTTLFADYKNECSAPTLQMAMKWLRENYEIFIQPNIVFLYPIRYFATIFCYGDNLKTQQDVETERFDTHEESCEAAIKYCLENLI